MLSKLQNLNWPGKDKNQKPNATSQPAKSGETGSPKNTPNNPGSTPGPDLQQRLASDKEKVRAAACLEVKDPAILLEISKTDTSDNIKLIAARQFARITPADESTKKTLDNYQASADTKHLARLITAHNNDAGVRLHGVSLFSSDADFLDIAVETRFHDTRRTVAQKITSLEVVDKCWRQLKSKDKLVARALKERLTEQSEQNEKYKNRVQEIEKVTYEMQKLAHGAWSPTFTHRFELFANRWDSIDFPITDEQRHAYDAARQIAEAKAKENLATQKQFDDCENIISALEVVPVKIKNATIDSLPELIASLKQQTTESTSTWQILARDAEDSNHPIDKAQQQKYARCQSAAMKELDDAESVLSACQQLSNSGDNTNSRAGKSLKMLEDLQSRMADSADKPAYAKDLTQLIQDTKRKVQTQQKESQELKISIKKQFSSLNSAITANRWGPAKSIHDRLTKKIERLNGHDKKHFSEQLQRAETKLKELGDWKQFATEPKLESLCDAMEKVPTLGLSMKDQADRIKELQNQWKSMGASPALDTHWPRFKKAADTAYEPCAKYFADKRAEKDNKIAKRTQICDMLQTYIDKSDWENPDPALVEKTIRTAKNEWRNARVFDRKANAKLDERFTRILSEIENKLDPIYAAGVAEKTDLIEKVKALSEGETNQHNINQVKSYQALWRVTGKTKRADDQRLWTEFNDACSVIYNAHRAKQKEQYAASMEHVTRAKQIITELKALTQTTSPVDEKNTQALQDEFHALAEFPERDQKYLSRDFNRAVEGLEKHRQSLTESAQAREIQRLRDNAALCEQLEQLAITRSDTLSDDIERIIAAWDNGEKTDKAHWKKAINLRKDSIIAHLTAGTQPDYKTNTQDRRLLCIENEILHECETPAEDKQLRMQYQLDRLQEGMSSATAATRQEQAAALEVRWLTSFPAEPDLRDKLNTRFNSAAR